MPEHVFTLAARGLSVDNQTNTLTVFAVVEQLGAHAFPAAVPEMALVSLWKREPGEEGVAFVQRTRFVDPSGEELGLVDQSFRFEQPHHRMLTHIRLFPVRLSGCHRIKVQIRRDDDPNWGAVVASYPIEVVAPQAESSETLLDASNPTAE